MNYSNINFPALALLLICWSCESPVTTADLTDDQQSAIQSLMQQGRIPGIQLTYFDANSTYPYVAGYRSWADSTRIDEATVFQANDLGHVVLMAICFRLQAAGELNLNDPIANLYADPRLAGQEFAHMVTFNHALSHTAGLPIWAGAEESIAIASIPGENWSYSQS